MLLLRRRGAGGVHAQAAASVRSAREAYFYHGLYFLFYYWNPKIIIGLILILNYEGTCSIEFA